MLGRLRGLRRLVIELPRNLKLAYCLAFDPRVPVVNKAGLAAAMALILTPFIDVPEWIPVVGQLDVIALTLLATHLFIASSDAAVVAEQEERIARRHSRFDEDVAGGRRLALLIASRFPATAAEADAEPAGRLASGASAGALERDTLSGAR